MIIKYSYTKTASGGAISFNTGDIRGVVYRILVKPTTSSTTYNVAITDDNSLEVYNRNGQRGKLNDLTQQTFRGIYTFAISNSSVDEEFKIQIEYDEVPS